MRQKNQVRSKSVFCPFMCDHNRSLHTKSFPGFFGEPAAYNKGSIPVLNYDRDSKFQLLNPEVSFLALYRALIFLRTLCQSCDGGKEIFVLFLNTNPEFTKMVKSHATFCNQYYITTKWVGGTLTNWAQVSKSIQAFHFFQKKWSSSFPSKNFHFPQFEKMKKCFFKTNPHP